jgi:hypothetical protein
VTVCSDCGAGAGGEIEADDAVPTTTREADGDLAREVADAIERVLGRSRSATPPRS